MNELPHGHLAEVNVFCNADRPWHRDKHERPRENGPRRYWVGRFTLVTHWDFIHPYSWIGINFYDESDEPINNEPTWGNVAITRNRLVRDVETLDYLATSDFADELLNHHGPVTRGHMTRTEWLSELTNSDFFTSPHEQFDLYDDKWTWEIPSATAAQHFNFVRESVNDAGQTVYLFECPCKKHYPPVVRNELLPVLDMLAEKDVREIPADTLIRAIQINRRR